MAATRRGSGRGVELSVQPCADCVAQTRPRRRVVVAPRRTLCALLARALCAVSIAARVRASASRAGGCARRHAALSFVSAAVRRASAAVSALSAPARGGLAVGGLLARRSGALAAVERVVERQPVVALIDGVVRVLQRVVGRREFLGGVPIGAGRARGVDRALRLLHFLVGRIAAARQRDENARSTSGDNRTTRRNDILRSIRVPFSL